MYTVHGPSFTLPSELWNPEKIHCRQCRWSLWRPWPTMFGGPGNPSGNPLLGFGTIINGAITPNNGLCMNKLDCFCWWCSTFYHWQITMKPPVWDIFPSQANPRLVLYVWMTVLSFDRYMYIYIRICTYLMNEGINCIWHVQKWYMICVFHRFQSCKVAYACIYS